MANIVHLTTAHSAFDTRIFDKECKTLRDDGHDVTLLCHHGQSEVVDGIQIKSLGTVDRRIERWKSIGTAAVEARQIDADLYHFHDPELLSAGIYLSRTTDAAIVYDVHEDFGHIATTREWIPHLLKPILAHGVPAVHWFASHWFDALVTVSGWIAETLPDHTRIEIVRNYPRTSSMPEPTRNIDREHDHVLVYVGGLAPVRGTMKMLRLLRELRNRGRDVGLWLVGGWRGSEDTAKTFIRENELGSHVRLPGYVDYEEMFRWLRSADVGLALLDRNHYEGGIPTKLFEYMYGELPIVGTRVDAAEKFLNEADYFWPVPEDDVSSQADTVERVLNAETGSSESQARQDVIEQFSWEAESERLRELYDSLLNTRSVGE